MKDAEKVGEMVRMDLEQLLMMELVRRYDMTLKEVETVCNFTKTLYMKNREEKSEAKSNK